MSIKNLEKRQDEIKDNYLDRFRKVHDTLGVIFKKIETFHKSNHAGQL